MRVRVQQQQQRRRRRRAAAIQAGSREAEPPVQLAAAWLQHACASPPGARASVSYATIFTVPSASYMRPAPHHSGYLGIINFQPVAPCSQTLRTGCLSGDHLAISQRSSRAADLGPKPLGARLSGNFGGSAAALPGGAKRFSFSLSPLTAAPNVAARLWMCCFHVGKRVCFGCLRLPVSPPPLSLFTPELAPLRRGEHKNLGVTRGAAGAKLAGSPSGCSGHLR
ncbi:hypothetical protein Q8A73_000143 [Channa argus]|nr:hypothetical protein Q8A73_000143 [Channa argus]